MATNASTPAAAPTWAVWLPKGLPPNLAAVKGPAKLGPKDSPHIYLDLLEWRVEGLIKEAGLERAHRVLREMLEIWGEDHVVLDLSGLTDPAEMAMVLVSRSSRVMVAVGPPERSDLERKPQSALPKVNLREWLNLVERKAQL